MSSEAAGCFSRRATRVDSEGAEKESSDTRRRMAAFRLPSSSFEATALARGVFTCFLLTSGANCTGTLVTPAEDGEVRLMIREDRFCFFPVLTGIAKMDRAQLKRASQLEFDLGWAAIS